MKRYKVAYLNEAFGVFQTKDFATYKQAFDFYKMGIKFNCSEAIIIDNIKNKMILRYDEFRSRMFQTQGEQKNEQTI